MQCKKEAKNAVAKAKAQALNEELETPEGERKIFRIAKAWYKSTKDYTQIKQIKDKNGMVMSDPDKIKERWKEYYEKLLNEENLRAVYGDGLQNQGVTIDISKEEIKLALKKMKNAKSWDQMKYQWKHGGVWDKTGLSCFGTRCRKSIPKKKCQWNGGRVHWFPLHRGGYVPDPPAISENL